jgi:hypothetical protein
MIDKRLVIALLFVLAGRFIGGPTAAAQPVVIDHEYEYKAAYLYHFARLCTWPGDQTGPIVIGVLGDPRPFGRHLERIERQSETSSRTMEVKRFADIDGFKAQGRACHILFVRGKGARPEQLQLVRQVIEATKGRATLIFTEDRAFAWQGAAVNFYIQGNRLKLLVNLEAAEKADVVIPPRLRGLRSVEVMPAAKGY